MTLTRGTDVSRTGRTPSAHTDEQPAVVGRAPAPRMVLYGDFNCPWSYLASRRAALLAADGVEIDWRAVEHDTPHRPAAGQTSAQGPARASTPAGDSDGRPATSTEPVELGPVLEEMQQVLTLLLPGEELPYALAGFAPHTGAAVAAYAEAYRAGVAGLVRQVLFEACWLHAFDLGDPLVVHTLIIDAVRSGTPGTTGTGPLATWEYGTGVDHQAGATTSRLLDTWATEWGENGNRTVPALAVGDELIHGVGAVTWLGAELVRRGLLPGGAPQPARASTPRAS